MPKPSINIEDEMLAMVDSELSYGDSRSEWIRHAIRMRLQVDPILDEVYESYQNEERIELVEAAVKKEVDRRRNGPHDFDDQSNDPL
jgi:metal-responsive CopG/Arc/MetJ family transcriptional regulator